MDTPDGQWAGAPGDSYPAIYKVRPWAKICVTGIAVAPVSLLFATITGSFHTKNDDLAYALVAFFAAFAVYGVAWALTAKITIYADRFEQRKPFIHRALPMAGIAGRRYTRSPGARYPVIVPRSGRPFSLDKYSYGLDGRFDRWFLHLKDLD